jgi:hypothetical protein
MRDKLREAWSKTITPEDYESHMASVGQAQANAAIVAEYLQVHPPVSHTSLLFAGAGSGQMFEFVSPEILFPFSATFTDINAAYLNRLRTRLAVVPGLRFTTVVDDIEHTTLSRRFDRVLAVLVLEHVDWRAAVSTMSTLASNEIFVVIQENPPGLSSAMTPRSQVPKTMQVFAEIHPELISASELESQIAGHGFACNYRDHKSVADGKLMRALGFRRNPAPIS